MKQVVATALVLLFTLFLLPLLLPGEEPFAGPFQPPAVTGTLPTDRIVVTLGQTADGWVQVWVAPGDGEVLILPPNKYLWRAMAVEMPASFEPEALKAQTVAARTYTLPKMERAVEAHSDVDVCMDITCRQAYIDPVDAVANWGENAQTHTDKTAVAVADTDGMVVLFQDQPIQAAFFSSVAGRTVGTVEVWGDAVSYLTSVDSPEGDEVPDYHSAATVPLDEFEGKLLAQYLQADLFGEPAGWFTNLVPNSAGGVETVNIGGVTMGGGSLRTLFGLCSTSFMVSASADRATFSITGYGRGAGMSQYGTNTLAKEGKIYDEILKWYYTGIDVIPYTPQRRQVAPAAHTAGAV